jgi:hypothetical protein
MLEHIKALGWIGIARASVTASAGGLLLYYWPEFAGKLAAEPWDALAFQIVGWVLVASAPLRLLQAIGALRGYPWALPFGLFLSGVDLINLLGFPVLTALGLYGLVVYRNAETREHFLSRARG